MSDHFDLAIIGSGPGGYRAAVLGALRGLRVAIVEASDWGGTCLNRGCVPKKAWHHSARLIAASRQFSQRGIDGQLRAELGQAWQHQRQVVKQVRDSYQDYIKRLGIKAYRGRGRLLDSNQIAIAAADSTTFSISAGQIILATGSRPRLPAWYRPELSRVLTTDQLFDHPPPSGEHVALLGTGVIGAELAFILSQLGKQIHWLGRGTPLGRSRFSPQAKSALRRALEQHDLQPSGAGVTHVAQQGEQLHITLDTGKHQVADWLCLAIGRQPNTADLGLDSVGIATDANGFIQTNARLKTQQPHIYAIGDCCNPAMTANHALHDAKIAIDNILGQPSERDNLRVPVAIHSAIELARIGLDEDAAIDDGFEPAVGFSAFSSSPRALGQDDSEGFVRLLADMDSGELLGGEIVGTEAGELIHLLALCPEREHALGWLADTSYNHPSRSEELLNAVDTMLKQWGIQPRR